MESLASRLSLGASRTSIAIAVVYILGVYIQEKIVTHIAKWGNSLGLRIPQNIAEQVGLNEGTPVVLEVSDGRLVVKPKRKKYSLAELLEGITPENLHPETDTGEEVGNEIKAKIDALII